ncbi:hypothetical protein [uncultured Methanobrevibacter sp.]|uniref:hypothetical protein n=1 Tax=uncultured Methanobrevibacter sp. TaxID=253161 RepID=UPI0025CFDBB4|nr:hypothetical protein [uncultured Methanobrevibacter sp.]
MDDNLFNSFLFCEGKKLYLNTAVSPNFILIAEKIFQKSYKIFYYELNPICPICGQPLNKNGLQKFILNKTKSYINKNTPANAANIIPWKNKKDLQNIYWRTKTNTIKQLKLDKKKCFGRKMKIPQLNFLHTSKKNEILKKC